MTTTVVDESTPPVGLFGWWKEGTLEARRALIAASLGWALDAFDVMLFSLTLASVIADLGLTKAQAGALGSITLLGGAAGGLLFGHVADRYGRTRALMASVLIYSVFTAACGFSQTLWQFAVFRALLGLGMGGEWASGAALVSETWPSRVRGRALGFMQGSWAIGFAAAAIVVSIVLPRFGWRAVFFVGVLPALFTVWVQRNVKEPEVWLSRRAASGDTIATGHARPARFADMFHGRMLPLTAAVTFMNACALFGWWGLNGWVGYITFGYITDRVGRKRVYIAYLVMASILLPLYGATRQPLVLLLLGPLVAFFGTGFFSGFGAVTAEIYPTSIRATAQGFTYNIGRVASAAAPFTVGSVATTRGFSVAFLVAGAAYLLGALSWVAIPETKGRELT